MSIGGVNDHVHMLIGLKPTHCVSDVVREIKKQSSVFVHDEIGKAKFKWQAGYAVFTLAGSGIEDTRKYIGGQAAHHRKISSRDELLMICKEAGVEPDMRYFD